MKRKTGSELVEFLRKSTIAEALHAKRAKARPLLTVRSLDTVESCLNLMQNENITSVPVVDESTTPFTVVALVDILDICNHVAFSKFSHDPSFFQKYVYATETMADLVKELPHTTRITTAAAADTLFRACELIGEAARHKLLVWEDVDGVRMLNMLSQLDLARFIALNSGASFVKQFPSPTDRSLSDLNLANPVGKSVLTVEQSALALSGFRMMASAYVHAVAVVDEKGVLVGNLSASDLRGLTASKLALVGKSVSEYLQTLRGGMAVPITVYSSTLLGEAMRDCVFAGVHRCWVVDSANKPLGVLSLTDVLKSLTQ